MKTDKTGEGEGESWPAGGGVPDLWQGSGDCLARLVIVPAHQLCLFVSENGRKFLNVEYHDTQSLTGDATPAGPCYKDKHTPIP